jgi:hypothetical protein
MVTSNKTPITSVASAGIKRLKKNHADCHSEYLSFGEFAESV